MTSMLLLVLPLLGAILCLLSWKHPRVQALIVFLTSVASALVALLTALQADLPEHYAIGAWPLPYGITLRLDGLSAIVLVLGGGVFSTATLFHYIEIQEDKSRVDPVYALAFPLALLAVNGIFLTADLFNFYVFFELLAVSSFILVMMGHRHPLEATWKYTVQSVLGSTLFLAGVGTMYGTTGELSLVTLHLAAASSATAAMPLLVFGLLLKGAVFPFHWWQPDAHAAAPTAGSVILAGLLIKVGIYGLLRLVPLFQLSRLHIIMLTIGVGSLLFGALGAWQQSDAKRLLGFSSVSQLGYIVLALGLPSVDGYAAALLFVLHHSVSKSLLFLVVGALSAEVQSTALSTLQGVGRGRPWLHLCFALGALSMAGLPPVIGFAAKISVLQAALFHERWLAAGLAALGGVFTLAYIVRLWSALFWSPPSPDVAANGRQVSSPAKLLLMAALAAALLVGTFYGRAIWQLCQSAADTALRAGVVVFQPRLAADANLGAPALVLGSKESYDGIHA